MSNADWELYSQIFLEDFNENDESKKLESLVGEKSLVAVLMFHFPNNYIGWLNTEVPALNGRKPVDCLTNEQGRLALKEVLMRMH